MNSIAMAFLFLAGPAFAAPSKVVCEGFAPKADYRATLDLDNLNGTLKNEAGEEALDLHEEKKLGAKEHLYTFVTNETDGKFSSLEFNSQSLKATLFSEDFEGQREEIGRAVCKKK